MATDPKTTQIAFERRYLDDSGTEFAVRYAARPDARVEFEHVGKVDFPVEELDWLIACLQRIRAEVSDGVPTAFEPSEAQITAALAAACLHDTQESRKDMRKALIAASGVEGKTK
jgi:hypothetical protein